MTTGRPWDRSIDITSIDLTILVVHLYAITLFWMGPSVSKYWKLSIIRPLLTLYNWLTFWKKLASDLSTLVKKMSYVHEFFLKKWAWNLDGIVTFLWKVMMLIHQWGKLYLINVLQDRDTILGVKKVGKGLQLQQETTNW